MSENRPRHILDPDFLKGGPGSGNFGHSGRPGERGGSVPKDGPADKKDSTRLKQPQETISVEQEDEVVVKGKLKPLADAAFTKLSNEHKASIQQYTQNGYIHTNRWLRGEIKEGHDVAPGTGEYLAQAANYIQQSIDKAGTLPEPLTVWRGIQGPSKVTALALAEKFQSKIGQHVELLGFQSTSVDKREALRFSGQETEGNLIFRISTRKGLAVNGHTATGGGDEGEVLLGHKWRYRVKDVKLVRFKMKFDKTDRIVVDLEVEN